MYKAIECIFLYHVDLQILVHVCHKPDCIKNLENPLVYSAGTQITSSFIAESANNPKI